MYTQFQTLSREKLDLEASPFVFVYGTLKNGYPNNHILGDCECMGTFETEDSYLMTDIGFPFLHPRLSVREVYGGLLSPARGEVYHVTEGRTLFLLDQLEGHPNLYYRTLVNVKNFEKPVWIYLRPEGKTYPEETLCPIVKGCYQWPS